MTKENFTNEGNNEKNVEDEKKEIENDESDEDGEDIEKILDDLKNKTNFGKIEENKIEEKIVEKKSSLQPTTPNDNDDLLLNGDDSSDEETIEEGQKNYDLMTSWNNFSRSNQYKTIKQKCEEKDVKNIQNNVQYSPEFISKKIERRRNTGVDGNQKNEVATTDIFNRSFFRDEDLSYVRLRRAV